MQKVVTFLWFAEQAEEAAALYTSLIPNSRIDRVTTMQAESPSGPPGSVQVVEFTLDGQQFQAMNAGPLDQFNHAISLVIRCESQQEIDRLWNGLGKDGEYEECGWLKDRYGVSWQITPAVLEDWMADKDPTRAKRVAEAMLQMQKLDIAGLKAAYEGKEVSPIR